MLIFKKQDGNLELNSLIIWSEMYRNEDGEVLGKAQFRGRIIAMNEEAFYIKLECPLFAVRFPPGSIIKRKRHLLADVLVARDSAEILRTPVV